MSVLHADSVLEMLVSLLLLRMLPEIQVLELVGTTTLEDSLQCANANGIVCMTGMVGNKWALDNFSPMGSIPTTVCLTTYAGGSEISFCRSS